MTLTLTRTGAQPVTLSEALGDQFRVRQRDRAGLPTNFLEWAERVPEPKTGRLNFDAFPPQRELYSDDVTNHREVVVMKSTQVGVSTWGLRAALHAADDRGDTALYIFPTQTHVSDFSAERVGPAIDGSEYLQRRIPPGSIDQVKMKRVGGGWVHFRGSESRAGAQSVAADYIVFDEYDDLSKVNLEQIERRVSGAKQIGREPRTRRVGIPVVEGYGVHARYEASDQRRWHVECPECGEDVVPDFFLNMRWRNTGDPKVRRWGKDDPTGEVEVAWRACHECEASLEAALPRGRWVAHRPGRRVIGFHLTRMCIPGTDLEEIVKNSRKREQYAIEAFYSNDLGIPYETEDGRLSRQALRAAQREFELVEALPPTADLVTMGVDVASRRNLTVRISRHVAPGIKRALFIGEAEDFDDVDKLMDRFNVNMAAVDHLPEGRLARAFANQHPGRVYVVAYDTTDRPRTPDLLKADYQARFATVRRTEVLDTMYEAIRAQRNELPETLPSGYEDQLRALVRKKEVDEKGNVKVWYEAKGPDDYAHAEVYDTAAKMLHEFHAQVTELLEGERSQLDEHVTDFRSGINDPERADDYHAGPQDLYYEGPEMTDDELGEYG